MQFGLLLGRSHDDGLLAPQLRAGASAGRGALPAAAAAGNIALKKMSCETLAINVSNDKTLYISCSCEEGLIYFLLSHNSF